MAGNYRYEEERFREQRGMGGGRRGYSELDRDDDEMRRESERFAGPEYGRGWGGRRQESGYDEGWRSEGGRYGRGGYGQEGYGQGRYGQGGYGQRGRQFGRGGRSYDESEWYGEGGRGYGERAPYRGGSLGSREYEGYDEEEGYGVGRPGGMRDRSRQGWSGSMQGDRWGETDEMRWGRQQGLYGSSEYSGMMSGGGMGQSQQSHAGKGPKGWQRSDDRLREDVNEALARHPGIDASDIEVRVQGGEVTLTGTVNDRQTKRQAEEVAERVFGAKDVQNQIRVKSTSETGRQGEREVSRTAEREGPQQEQSRRSGPTVGGSTSSTNR